MTRETPIPKSKKAHLAWQCARLWSFIICHSFSVILFLLAGCAVGPNYSRPPVTTPAVFRGDNAPTNASFADLDWWQVYQDTTLQALVREGFTNNYDLRMAMSRVEQARALAMQARSQFVPSVNYSGT